MTPRTLPLTAAVAALLWAPPGAASHRDPARLKPGLFLYAAPGLPDANFAESVVLLIRHGEQGSMGLIVNRPTSVLLRDALDELEELRGSDLPLHTGGPVQPETILALVRSSSRLEGTLRVLPDVYLSGDLEHVRVALRAREPASRLRVFAGYAGWGAGQLAGEVRRGYWVFEPAEAGSLFTRDPSSLWPRVHRLLGRIEVRLRPEPAERGAAP